MKTSLFKPGFSLLLFFIFFNHAFVFAQPTWTAVSATAPFLSGGGLSLLPDGSVLCKTSNGTADGFGNMWMKLSPDITGSYVNGTWSLIAPMRDSRLYFSSQVLKDGRLYIGGGEYGSGFADAEIYDPASNSWTSLATPGFLIGDACSEILDNGKVLQAIVGGSASKAVHVFDPASNTYSAGPNTLFSHNEASWVKLRDGSILTVDLASTTTERYIPALNQWVTDATVPVTLYDNFGFETGPALLLPDGRALFLGSTGNTALYTPSGNNGPGSWVAGPQIPLGMGCPDAPGAVLPDGKVLFTAGPSPLAGAVYVAPTYFFEYDYISNTMTQVSAFTGQTLQDTAFNTSMIILPDGNLLSTVAFTKNYFIHAPSGPPLAAAKPTVSTLSFNNCAGSGTVTGFLFNGINQGAYYGDDWQMNTNYPLIRLQSGNNVYYVQTHHWNHTKVHNPAVPDTVRFQVPGNVPPGTYSLFVVANGVSSAAQTFSFSAFPALTSPLHNIQVCSGGSFTYAPQVPAGMTYSWTRPAMPGISNAAITVPQTAVLNETLNSTNAWPLTVVYHFTVSNGSCNNVQKVSVVVNVASTPVVQGNTIICSGKPTTLKALGLSTYSWSTGATTRTVFLSPPVTTAYTLTGNNDYGCFSTKVFTVSVKQTPTLSVSGNQTICAGESVTVHVRTNANAVFYGSQLDDTVKVFSPSTSTLIAILASANGCLRKDSVQLTVMPCLSVNAKTRRTEVYLFPQPVHEFLEIRSGDAGLEWLRIHNVLGEALLSVDLAGLSAAIDLHELPPGMYLLELGAGGTAYQYRIIRE